jgi:hypothetical protein
MCRNCSALGVGKGLKRSKRLWVPALDAPVSGGEGLR